MVQLKNSPVKGIELEDADVCSLSTLWLINGRLRNNEYGSFGWLVQALLVAGIPLYFIDEDFDSELAFVEYQLTATLLAEVRQQILNADFNGFDSPTNKWSEYFEHQVCAGYKLGGCSVPFWFESNVRLKISDVALSNRCVTIRVASLFVKPLDVKVACQLQGIEKFYWPANYPLLNPDHIVEHRMEKGLWVRRVVRSISSGN